MLAEGFAGRVAVQPLGGGVPVGDAPVQGLGENGVLGGLDQRGEFVDACFGGLSVADVTNRRREKEPVGRLQRTETDLHRKLGTVLTQTMQLQPSTHRANLPIRRIAIAMTGMLSTKPARHQHLHRTPQQLITPVAEQRLRLRIDQGDQPSIIHDHHGVRSRLQQPPKPLLRRRTFHTTPRALPLVGSRVSVWWGCADYVVHAYAPASLSRQYRSTSAHQVRRHPSMFTTGCRLSNMPTESDGKRLFLDTESIRPATRTASSRAGREPIQPMCTAGRLNRELGAVRVAHREHIDADLARRSGSRPPAPRGRRCAGSAGRPGASGCPVEAERGTRTGGREGPRRRRGCTSPH